MALTAASMGGLVTVATTAYAVSSPTITMVNPNSLPAGASHQLVTLTGTNFQSGAKVLSHSGIKAPATFVSATQLDLSVSVASTVAPGKYNLNLTNPDGGKFPCTGCLTVTSGTTSPPTVTSVSPTTLNQNTTTPNFTITGTNFTSGASVSFSTSGVSASSVTFVSATSLTATVTVSPTAPIGSSDVAVTTAAGPGTCTACLTVASGTSPTITAVNPNTLPAGATNQPVTLTGTNFESGATVVSHAGIKAAATFVSATQLDLSVTVATTVGPGSYNLDLTNPDGGKFHCISCLTVTEPGADWSAYLDGPQHSSYNPAATSITPSNIGSLNPVWRWLPPMGATKNRIFASPTIVNGIAYVGSENGYFYAVNEATRALVWQPVFLGVSVGIGTNGCGTGRSGVISTATVTTDPGTGKLTVYENAPDGHLYAIDALTGTVLWTGVVGIPGSTNPTIKPILNDYYAWGSPLVARGKVYVGISSQCDNPLVQGGLLSFTQDSSGGATNPPFATFHTLPDSVMCDPPQTTPGCGGSIWSSPAVANDGSIIVTTGNGPPIGNNGDNNPPNSASLVKLDPNSLMVLAAFQIPYADTVGGQDFDWGGSPTVFTATIGGVATPMVGACNKDGHYYGLRQSDWKMMWDYQMGAQNSSGGASQCDAAAIWDGTHLIAGGGSPTTINGVLYPGSVQSLDPATGHPIWQTPLQGNIVGSPSEDGAGVIAAPVYTTTRIDVATVTAGSSTVTDAAVEAADVGKLVTATGMGSATIPANTYIGSVSVGVSFTLSSVGPDASNFPQAVVATGSGTNSGVTSSSTTVFGVYLLSATTGDILGFVPTPLSHLFSQPVFAGNDLLVGAGTDLGLTAYEITQSGPPITAVSPSTLTHGTSATLTITGSGFSGTPQVIFTNTLVQVNSVVVTSSTTLSVTVTADATAPIGPATIVVSEPGAPATSDICTNCLTIN